VSHGNKFIMPMATDGTTIYFDSWNPTDYELQHSPHIILSLQAEWNPREVQFPTAQRHAEQGKDLTYNLMHNASGISSRRFDLSGSSHNEVSISRLIADRFVAEV
jgi:hypothetical protein